MKDIFNLSQSYVCINIVRFTLCQRGKSCLIVNGLNGRKSGNEYISRFHIHLLFLQGEQDGEEPPETLSQKFATGLDNVSCYHLV